MSTRANVIIKEGKEQLFFYRHSDGYPETTEPVLKIFLSWLKDRKIRNNISQASGWLVLLGALEYNNVPKYNIDTEKCETLTFDMCTFVENPKDWKVGAFEPTTGIHGDIEYLYTIDLIKETLITEKYR